MIDVSPTTQEVWTRSCALALAELPGMGPARLQTLLADMPPDVAWTSVAEGRSLPPEVTKACGANAGRLLNAWAKAARRIDPLEILARYERSGVGVWMQMGEYPTALMSDPFAPPIL